MTTTTRPVITVHVNHADVRRVANLRLMLLDANSDDRHAAQRPGHLYGDLTTALNNLLGRITGDPRATDLIHEYLLDTHGNTAETMDAIAGGIEDAADAVHAEARVVWTGTPDEPATDPRFRSVDGARFRAIVPQMTW